MTFSAPTGSRHPQVGAVLNFALTVSPNQHGFNVHTIGIILLIVVSTNFRRHRTVIDDGRRNVVRRDNTSPRERPPRQAIGPVW
jgi:hypothetical protein